MTYPNGVATDYSYDLAGRATDISTSGAAGDVLELGYAYTPGSLVSSRSTSRAGGAPVSESVTWDAAARLSTISSMSSGVPVQYTPSHEVTRADDGAQLAWGTDGSLASRTFGTDVTSYASDLSGRRTSSTTASGDVTSFGWDQVGRLTGVGDTASGSATDYTYAGGLRVGAETTTGEDTTSEVFQWDTLAGVPLLLSDGAHEYIYALGSAPVAQVDTVTGVVTFLHGDLVGSTRAATDASGTVVGTWDYSTFGVTTTATGGAAGDGAGVTRFLFAGEYQDDTGLYYLRARFYDPVTASFLSVDPALAQTGSPYAYAAGNPLQMVDPLGLWPGSGLFDDVKAAVSSTVDAVQSAASATGNWIVDNKGLIIGTVVGIAVGAGCLAITAGAGSVACAALGGAVGGMVTYGIDTPVECWTAGGFFVSGAVGGVMGGLTAGLGNAVAPFLSKVVTATAARATPALKGALSKVTTLFKPRASVVDDALEDACAGGLCKAPGQCFVAGTGVLLADGSLVAVEDVEIGDLVLTTDPDTGVESAHAVTELFRHDNAELFDVVIDGSTVTATPSHPFWVVGRGWVPVDQLDTGDQLLQPDDTTVAVESVTATGKTATVYNFEVDGAHDYYVKSGDHWVLVHNDCGQGTMYHYTNAEGAAGIEESGVIRAGSDGKVFMTDQALSPAEAEQALFAGAPDYVGKGDFLVEFEVPEGIELIGEGQLNELWTHGSIRPSSLTVWPNPFGR